MILFALSLALQEQLLVAECKESWNARGAIESVETAIVLQAVRERLAKRYRMKLFEIYRLRNKAREIEI